MDYVFERGRVQKQLPGWIPPSPLTPPPPSKGESTVHSGDGEALGVVFGQGIVYALCFLTMFLLSVRPRAGFRLGF